MFCVSYCHQELNKIGHLMKLPPLLEYSMDSMSRSLYYHSDCDDNYLVGTHYRSKVFYVLNLINRYGVV